MVLEQHKLFYMDVSQSFGGFKTRRAQLKLSDVEIHFSDAARSDFRAAVCYCTCQLICSTEVVFILLLETAVLSFQREE